MKNPRQLSVEINIGNPCCHADGAIGHRETEGQGTRLLFMAVAAFPFEVGGETSEPIRFRGRRWLYSGGFDADHVDVDAENGAGVTPRDLRNANTWCRRLKADRPLRFIRPQSLRSMCHYSLQSVRHPNRTLSITQYAWQCSETGRLRLLSDLNRLKFEPWTDADFCNLRSGLKQSIAFPCRRHRRCELSARMIIERPASGLCAAPITFSTAPDERNLSVARAPERTCLRIVLLQKLQRCLLVTGLRHKTIHEFALVLRGAPTSIPLAVDLHEHLVGSPLVKTTWVLPQASDRLKINATTPSKPEIPGRHVLGRGRKQKDAVGNTVDLNQNIRAPL